MAPTVPLGLPIRARAGDSWQFDVAYGDYPAADGWTPAVHIRGAKAPAWDASWAAAQGTGWRITIPAATTADLTAGTYTIAAILTGSGAYAGQVVTAEAVACLVEANLATAAAGEQVPWEETAIASLRTAIAALVSGGVSSYTIGGRQVVYQDLPELRKMLGELEARLARKQNPTGLGQRVLMRFSGVGA